MKSQGHPQRVVGLAGGELENAVQVERTFLSKAWNGPHWKGMERSTG